MIEKLAFSLGRNDELPNIELAQQLCKENNAEGIKEIVEGLKTRISGLRMIVLRFYMKSEIKILL